MQCKNIALATSETIYNQVFRWHAWKNHHYIANNQLIKLMQ